MVYSSMYTYIPSNRVCAILWTSGSRQRWKARTSQEESWRCVDGVATFAVNAAGERPVAYRINIWRRVIRVNWRKVDGGSERWIIRFNRPHTRGTVAAGVRIAGQRVARIVKRRRRRRQWPNRRNHRIGQGNHRRHLAWIVRVKRRQVSRSAAAAKCTGVIVIGHAVRYEWHSIQGVQRSRDRLTANRPWRWSGVVVAIRRQQAVARRSSVSGEGRGGPAFGRQRLRQMIAGLVARVLQS